MDYMAPSGKMSMEWVLLLASHISSLPETGLQDTTGLGSFVIRSRESPPPPYSWDEPMDNSTFSREAGVGLRLISPFILSDLLIQKPSSQLFSLPLTRSWGMY